MAREINTLPPEIIAAICVLLSRHDLRNIRLLCCAWDNAAQRILFETVFLRINLRSFEKLQAIARHEKLNQHVRNISYDPRALESSALSPARRGFNEWLRLCAGQGLCLSRDRAKFLALFSTQQLEKYYSNYCQYLSAQAYILRQDNEKEMLTDALRKLPRVRGVQRTEPSMAEYRIWNEVPLLGSLSPIAREILAEPESCHRYLQHDVHFWNLLQSACVSDYAQQLKDVRGSRLDLKRWNGAAKLGDCYSALSTLHHLSLKFAFAVHGNGETTQLADMIAHASSLLSLRLSFTHFSVDIPPTIIDLQQVICDTAHWRHLRSLSLQAVVTPEGFLRDLLQRHAQSLRSLELSNINFIAATVPDQYGRGSWIHFIHFLNQEMSLEHIRFTSSFSNSWDEAWETFDADWDKAFHETSFRGPYSDDCLKYQIERFITHGGPCPFTAATGEVSSHNYYHLPWVFKEDESWYFCHQLIQ